MSVSRPKVLFKTEKNIKLEPVEEVVIDVDESFSSTVISSMNNRKSEMIDMKLLQQRPVLSLSHLQGDL